MREEFVDEHTYATVIGCFEQWQRLVFLDHPGLPSFVADAHGAEDGVADAETRPAELAVGCFWDVHGC